MGLSLFGIDAGLAINDNIYILEGSADPTAGGGVVAPIGSIYARTSDGTTWHKVGSGDTAWNQILDSAGASVEDGYQNTFMGKSGLGSETPTYSSTHVVTTTTSLETAIGALDAEIGAAVSPVVRTYKPISDQAINLNINQLDGAIGTDAEHTSTTYTAVNESLKTSVSKLDAALAASEPFKVSATNQDLSLGVAVDSVAVATVSTVEWLVTVKSATTGANRSTVKIVALNDGTITNIDYNVYSKLKVGSNISGLSFDVIGAAGNMSLEITASENVDYDIARITLG